ncbi:MAG: type II secretion system F family protein [Pseudomonadota bacterium]
MVRQYKYRAINNKGRATRGVMQAANERDLYAQLRGHGLELADCKEDKPTRFRFLLGASKIKTRDLIGFFTHLQQLQQAGVPLLDSLADARDSADIPAMRDMVGDILRDVSEGTALSDAFAKFPQVFPTLFIAMVRAGESTGDMVESYSQLIRYLKWYDELSLKIKKAKRYPMILGGVIAIVLVIMMGYVVPQIVDFIRKMDQELPWYTTSLIATSDFFKSYWYMIFAVFLVMLAIHKSLYQMVLDYRLNVDKLVLKLPIFGPITRKINIARYTRTFGVLFAGGIDIINCLRYSQTTITNRHLYLSLNKVEEEVSAGHPFSLALNETGEFPSMVIRMIKIGEETGNLRPVLDQVTEFYSRDVDEAIQSLVALIEPALTLVMGGIILWIAAGVFGPIYNSFGNMTM